MRASANTNPRFKPSKRYLVARGLLPKVQRARPTATVEVYFIRAATVGLIKIGKADNARTRFRNLQMMSPDTLILMGVMVCNEGGVLERVLHRRFAEHRRHGEWFAASDDLIAFIRENVASPAAKTPWREIRSQGTNGRGRKLSPTTQEMG